MRALTLTQPYATLVAVGEKRIETRSWQSEYRGPLAIHAARGFPRDYMALCTTHPFSTALRKHGINRISTLPRGAIVATCRLLTVVRLPAAATPHPDSWEFAFGDYSKGRYIWVLEDIVPVEPPFPAIGSLGLWEWDDAAAERVKDARAQL